MTLFLRNKNKRSIVDLEIYIDKSSPDGHKFIEIESTVVVDTYSEFLVENLERKEEIIKDFSEISELRGWLWESFFMDDENDPSKFKEVVTIVKDSLKEIAKRYDLYYVED
jgi:hypothetical protein